MIRRGQFGKTKSASTERRSQGRGQFLLFNVLNLELAVSLRVKKIGVKMVVVKWALNPVGTLRFVAVVLLKYVSTN